MVISWLCICSIVLAETKTWSNSSGDGDWSNSLNWIGGVPGSSDTAHISPPEGDPIIFSGSNTASLVKLGYSGSGDSDLYINAGATLSVGTSVIVGDGTDGIVNVNGGFLDIVLGPSDTYGYLVVGGGGGGNGFVEMTGGMIQAWNLLVGYYSGTGTVNLHSGTIDIVKPGGGLTITERGLVNIEGGEILLDGDQTVTCSDHISSERIIAFDGNGTVMIDYDNVNAGKTTIWAVGPTLPADFDTSKRVDLPDLAFFISTWLDNDLQVRPIGDIDGDSEVNIVDLSMLASDWLQEDKLEFSLFIGAGDCPGYTEFADPYVFQEGDSWYLTSTYTAGSPMYMFCTSNFSDKERYTLNLDLNESYLRTYFGEPGLNAYHVWGFVPYKHTDNSWHAYASIHVGSYQTFVCHFSPYGSSVWPITDWQLDKVLVGSPSNIAYESKIYSDASGMYLIYVDTLNDGDNHIMAQKMLDPDDLDYSFTARAILSPEGLASEYRNPPSGMQIVEGPNISYVVTPEGSKYVMFYAVGDYALSNYKLGVAYSNVLIPAPGQQYSKPKVYDSYNVWLNSVPKNEVVYTLQTQIPDWFNYCGSLLDGPGLGNLFEYLGNYYSVFHAREQGDTGTGAGRWTWICPVTIDFSTNMETWVSPQLP
jgi:hypothetical protein